MKIKKNFILRQVADIWVVMPIGDEAVDFNGMMTLNETGALLWKALEQGGSAETLADALTAEYNVSREEALADAEEFCRKLIEAGCAEA